MSTSRPVALVTGAARRIGAAIARRLHADGFDVALHHRDSAADMQALADQLRRARPDSVLVLHAELSEFDRLPELVAHAIGRFGRLDALVNNAAVYSGRAPQIWAVNLLGPLRLTRALLPLLARNARVVMVTSGLGRLSAQPAGLVRRLSDPKLSLGDLERLAEEAPGGYGESKAALNALARIFAHDLEPQGILVNAISPGWCRTDMGGRSAPRSIEQGAASVLWGVRLQPGGPTGGVFQDGKAMA